MWSLDWLGESEAIQGSFYKFSELLRHGQYKETNLYY